MLILRQRCITDINNEIGGVESVCDSLWKLLSLREGCRLSCRSEAVIVKKEKKLLRCI